jgi:pyruvate/2-oxoglutarate dehydrogenase complex dihydrolipoamide acyltransferase (E2) component
VITGLPAPGNAVVEVAAVASGVLLEIAVAALEVERVVVVVVVLAVLDDAGREVPHAPQASAVRTTAARRAAAVAEPWKRIG